MSYLIPVILSPNTYILRVAEETLFYLIENVKKRIEIEIEISKDTYS